MSKEDDHVHIFGHKEWKQVLEMTVIETAITVEA